MAGLGPVTGISDGYPWGLWIAFDVVTGTAFGCGGLAIALLVYLMNRNQYHPLVRPALLTSAIGYTLAVFAVAVDVGRPWSVPKLPLVPWRWNFNSAQLEVALCVAAYVLVLWVEFAPALLEKWQNSSIPWVRDGSRKALAILRPALLWVIALGILLPIMHQSSLGTMVLLGGNKLHALWNTQSVPLLFLVSVIAMGYAVVVFESTIASLTLKRKAETHMLAAVAGVMPYFLFLFLALRFADIIVRGRAALMFQEGGYSVLFWVENVLFLLPAVMLLSKAKRARLGYLFRAAIIMLVAGTLYRFDAYIVAFNPGPGWSYFPTVPEILISVAFVAASVLMYVFFVKKFPVLSAAAPAASKS
jgi:Ni/Fe-hydrogenase subunit HybB-like protein